MRRFDDSLYLLMFFKVLKKKLEKNILLNDFIHVIKVTPAAGN